MKEQRTIIRYGFLLTAVILLANPSINLFDPLPDFVAYILLAMGISYAADAFPYFAEAREGFVKLMWINLSKVPALILMLVIWSNDTAQKSIITVFALTYAVIELIFLIPAFRNLFEGFFYLGERHGCIATITLPSTLQKLRAEQLTTITVGFFAVRAALACLPEFSLIYLTDIDQMTGGLSVNWVSYYPLLLLLALVLGIAFGCLWAYMMFAYLRHLRADRGLQDFLRSHFADKAATMKNKDTYRILSVVLTLLIAAVGFGLDFIFDDINVLPDVVSAGLFCAAMLFMLRLEKRARPAAVASAVYAAFSLANYLFTVKFLSQYAYSTLAISEPARHMYSWVLVTSAAEFLAFAACLLLLAPVLVRLILHYIGGEQAPDSSRGPYDAQYCRQLCRRTRLFVALGLCSGLSTFAYQYLIQFTQTVRLRPEAGMGLSATMPMFGWFWTVPLALSVIWLVYAANLFAALRQSAETRWMDT
ncbi:MAG: hypothetical protein WDA00_00825 [Eubacteriales bacterium]